ncbi:MAG: Gfo/Idh/MocA family oxidoreductase [Clostridia bacterium]|nr:Gfo/Idh/MocA family oxidoreductase [Clostridia bacterium]
MNIALLSAWHVHANDYARQLRANGANLFGVWDEEPERGKKWAGELGVPFYADYRDLLKEPNLDGVVLCSATSLHPELLLAAAKAKKHIFTEKVLTLTARDAYAVRDAIKENGILFTISFPHQTNPRLLYAKQMIEEGKLGQLTYARVRNCHSGSIRNWLPPHFYSKEQCGGGAMIDLGAHPMYLLNWFLGRPARISSCFTNATDRPVEDNAVSLLEYENGAIGVSETGFVSLTDPFEAEISGTRGYLKIDRTLSYCLEGGDWVTVPDESIGLSRPLPIPYWLSCMEKGETPVYYTIDEAVTLSEMMDCAYRSSASGRFAELSDLS